jgi:hypothetical protein
MGAQHSNCEKPLKSKQESQDRPVLKAPLVAGDNNQVIICDAAERAKLVALRREALEAMNPKQIEDASNDAGSDSGNSSALVQ